MHAVAKLLIVVTNIRPATELIERGSSGLVHQPRTRLLNSPETRSQMAKSSSRTCIELNSVAL